jgi:serine/threonine-protein kinase HipA
VVGGALQLRPAGGGSFTYAVEWLDRAPAFPISRQLPLRTGAQAGDHVHAVFENLLPDLPDLRRRIAERNSAQSDLPHDLLAAIGRDCVGAMQFLPPGADPGDPFAIEGQPQSEAEIAATLRDLATTPLGLRPGEAFHISLAGAQEKTAYLRHQGAWMKSMGLTPMTHVFKE